MHRLSIKHYNISNEIMHKWILITTVTKISSTEPVQRKETVSSERKSVLQKNIFTSDFWAGGVWDLPLKPGLWEAAIESLAGLKLI